MATKRSKSGQKAGIIGLLINLILFAGKLVVGILSNSVASLADAFNNLTDSASAIITIAGFNLASKRKDKGHPHGHGRIEYVSGLIVSILIIFTALSFGKISIEHIIRKDAVHSTESMLIIPIASILIKLLLALYLKVINKKVKSATLRANIWDSLADSLVTSVTIISLVFSPHTSIPIDGIIGLFISLFILWSGYRSFRENISLIVGKATSPELQQSIKNTVLKYDSFKSINELEIHDYGPEYRIAVIQVELAKTPHSMRFENQLRKLQSELRRKFKLDATIYWPANKPDPK